MLRDYYPVIRANAIAAAVFAALLAVLYPFMLRLPASWQTPAILALTLAYVLLINRYLTKLVPPPPELARKRKGSHKKEKGRGWGITRWVATVMIVGVAVQMGVFMIVYVVVRSLMSAITGI